LGKSKRKIIREAHQPLKQTLIFVLFFYFGAAKNMPYAYLPTTQLLLDNPTFRKVP